MVQEYLRARASVGLRGLVAGYSGYREAGVPAQRHRGLPSPYLTLIFTLDDPLHVAQHPDRSAPAASFEALVGGLHTTPAIITHDGRQSGVQVALSPLGARALFGLPAGELAGHDLPADAVLGRCAEQVRERLLAAADWPARFAAVDELLRDRASRAASPDPAAQVSRAWQRLIGSGGRIRVAQLAAEVGWGTRYLHRRFTAEVGLTPKEAARVVRFDRARRELARRAAAGPGRPVLAAVACDTGYYDQAHLAREFTELAGCAPSRWLAEQDRFLQALPTETGARWDA